MEKKNRWMDDHLTKDFKRMMDHVKGCAACQGWMVPRLLWYSTCTCTRIILTENINFERHIYCIINVAFKIYFCCMSNGVMCWIWCIWQTILLSWMILWVISMWKWICLKADNCEELSKQRETGNRYFQKYTVKTPIDRMLMVFFNKSETKC